MYIDRIKLSKEAFTNAGIYNLGDIKEDIDREGIVSELDNNHVIWCYGCKYDCRKELFVSICDEEKEYTNEYVKISFGPLSVTEASILIRVIADKLITES